MLGAPSTGVGGIDCPQVDAGLGGHGGEPVTEHRSRDPRYSAPETFPPDATAHGLAPGGAGVGEVEVFDRDRGDGVAAGVAQQLSDGVAHLRVAARRAASQVDVDPYRCSDRVAVCVEAAQRQMPVVEIHSDDRTRH